MARKMALVPKEMLSTKEEKSLLNPIAEKTLQLDQEMKTVLDRQDLPESRKMQMYAQILETFLNFYRQKKIMDQTSNNDYSLGFLDNSLKPTPKEKVNHVFSKPSSDNLNYDTPEASVAKKSIELTYAPQKAKSKRKATNLNSVRKWLKY